MRRPESRSQQPALDCRGLIDERGRVICSGDVESRERSRCPTSVLQTVEILPWREEFLFDDVTRSVSEGECSAGLVDGEAFWSVRPR